MSLLFILSITSDLQTPSTESFRGFTFLNEIILDVWNHPLLFKAVSSGLGTVIQAKAK